MLRGVLQENNETDENLTDSDDDVVSANESESDEQMFLKTFNNYLTFYLTMISLSRNCSGNLNW